MREDNLASHLVYQPQGDEKTPPGCHKNAAKAGIEVESEVLVCSTTPRTGDLAASYRLQAASQSKSRPADAVRWAENEPVVDGGNLPRPFRHLRVAEHRTPNREPGPLFIEYRFKKRLPPAPTLQAGFQADAMQNLSR